MAVQWFPIAPWTAQVPLETFLSELRALNLEEACEVYRIRHRSVFKTSLPPLGEVAVKEVRHLRLKQRFKLRQGGRSKAEREFSNAQALYQKGVATPAPYALGLDRDWLGLHRVWQIYEWLPSAETLTECVERGDRPWVELSAFLWKCARAGLVHGGHSSENLLRCEGRWHVIDLAEARIGEAYHRGGFVRDVARIIRKLLREKALPEAQAKGFIEAVVAQSGGDNALRQDIPQAMERLLEEGRSRHAAKPDSA